MLTLLSFLAGMCSIVRRSTVVQNDRGYLWVIGLFAGYTIFDLELENYSADRSIQFPFWEWSFGLNRNWIMRRKKVQLIAGLYVSQSLTTRPRLRSLLHFNARRCLMRSVKIWKVRLTDSCLRMERI